MNATSVIVRNPATQESIAEIPIATRAEVAAAVERARPAQQLWQQSDFATRRKRLYTLRDILLDEKERIADILVSETGRPRSEATGNELFYLCDAIGMWAKKGEGFLCSERIWPHFPLVKTKQTLSTYAPRGVIGIISPWNFPLTLTLGEAIPAMLAGNAVIVKPSELTPLSCRYASELTARAGFPQDLFQVVVGFAETAEAVIDNVDMISFTGSVETGKKVMKRAADRLIPVTLELGGKDPMIVLKDAKLERAAGACVWGALMNSGQACTSIERVYVEEPVFDTFVDLVVKKVRALRQGPSDGDIDIACMTSEAQIKIIEEQLADAMAKGAQILCGGHRNAHLGTQHFEPTVLVEVNHDMRIMREETFGPIIPIMKVASAAHALQLANDSAYGLGASVFCQDRADAMAMARSLQCGAVCINDSLVNYIIPDAPMGGMKESGFGHRHGAEGIRKYCHQKTIVIDRFGLKEEFPWYPNSPKKVRQTHHLLRLLCRSGWNHKLKAFLGLLKS